MIIFSCPCRNVRLGPLHSSEASGVNLAVHNEKRMIDTVSYLLAARTRVRHAHVHTCPMMLLSLCSQVEHPKHTDVYRV